MKKNYYISRDIEFFLGDFYFLVRPVYLLSYRSISLSPLSLEKFS